LPSEIATAFLFAQNNSLNKIQDKRKHLSDIYFKELFPLAEQQKIQVPEQPLYAENNAHIFYIVCKSVEERVALISFLRTNSIQAMFHYIALHTSKFYLSKNKEIALPNAKRFSDCLLRHPLFPDLSVKDIKFVPAEVKEFYE
jgi:dTDP-4-amino-4,6-dideoxygalactose transaminase